MEHKLNFVESLHGFIIPCRSICIKLFDFQGMGVLLDKSCLPSDTGPAAWPAGLLENLPPCSDLADDNNGGRGMKLEVRMFAVARDLAGSERISVELPNGATIADLRQQLIEQVPGLAPMAPQLMFAIDEQYSTDTTPLRAEADVACIPPVSGG